MKFSREIPSIAEVVESRHYRIEYKVDGFWSEPLSIYLKCDGLYSSDFRVEISRSSGGRDVKEIECDIEAHENYLAALSDAIEVAKFFKSHTDDINEMIAEKRKAALIEAEKVRAERARLEKADPPIGIKAATKIVEDFKKSGKNCLVMYTRGMYYESRVYLNESANGSKRFYVVGLNESKKSVIERVATKSSTTLPIFIDV